MKKFISILLTIIIFTSCFSGCGSASAESYIMKGEFFYLLMEQMNYYPIDSTTEEIENSTDYEIEAQSMVDWNVLPKELAFGDLEEPLTKEIAVLSCYNTMYFTEEGNIEEIKDKDKLYDAKSIANAVATGLIELHNGYFDAMQKMTYDESMELIEKSQEFDSEGHFEDGSGTVEYDFGDDAIIVSDEDIGDEEIIVKGYDTASTLANEGTNNESISGLTDLTYHGDDSVEATNIAKTNTFSVIVSTRIFEQQWKSPKKGNVIVYDPHLTEYALYSVTARNGFAGKLISAKNMGITYECILEKLEDEVIMEHTKVSKVGSTAKKIKFEQLETSINGFKIKIDNENNGIRCTVSKTFKIQKGGYNNWRDQQATPKVTFSSYVGNVHVDMDNIGLLFKKGKTSEKNIFKLTYDTSSSVELECGGLRYTPDSNRNGKFWNNLSKSRFTNGAGAKRIKVAKFPIPIANTGFTIECGVYLSISIDGKISISLDQTNGFQIIKSGEGISIKEVKKRESKTEVNANLTASLDLDVKLNSTLVKNIISGYGKIELNILAKMTLYYKEEKVSSGYGDPDEALYGISQNSDLDFCTDVTGNLLLKIGLYGDNLLGKVSGKFGYDMSKLKVEFNILSFGFHNENGSFVKKCTMGEKEEEEELPVTDDETFTLSKYKMHITTDTCDMLYITGLPISEKKLAKTYKKGIQVSIKDKDIADVFYDDERKIITISGKSMGSTEVSVYVQKDKKTGKQYLQKFSVTVAEEVTKTEFSNYSISFKALFVA